MKVVITGKNIEITDAIKNAIESSLAEVDKYFTSKELEAKVLVRTYNVGQKVEIEIVMDKDHVIRQEETADDLYDAINSATRKIERQVRKFKSRLTDYSNKESISKMFSDEGGQEWHPKITKRKEFEDKLMTEAEALLQFDLIGHDFFIFTDANTLQTKVLYKRKDDEYGTIEVRS